MLIKDLIIQLQELYATYDDECKQVMGEPEIMIDVFKLIRDADGKSTHVFSYQGFGKEVLIEKSSDGVYDILSRFEDGAE